MENILKILMCAVLGIGICACELDNYDATDTQFHGSIIDEETNEPIEQDLFEGSRIDIIELGYENPDTRQIRFHSDGTFQENNLFSGQYVVQALRGNFWATDVDTVSLNGDTEYNFTSLPYIRIENVEMSFDSIAGVVTASFTLDQVSSNPVESVILLADKNPNVSYSLRTLAVEENVNKVVAADKTFKLELSTENLETAGYYYFRVGALISDVTQAKRNYSPAVRLYIDNSNVVPEVVIEGNVLDECESLDGWESGITLSLSSSCKQGSYSVSAIGNGVVLLQKVFSNFDTQVSMEKGYLAFYMYIENTSVFGSGDSQFELTSSGGCDVNEVHWTFDDLNLSNGWNKVELSLANATDVDLSAVNYIRFYHTGLTAELSLKIDYIRFYEKDE